MLQLSLCNKIVVLNRIEQLIGSFERSSAKSLYGASITSFTKDMLCIEVEEDLRFKRPSGVFNGATIAAMVDAAAGYLSAAQYPMNSYMATIELKVNYLRPAYGEKLIFEATCLKSGKQISTIRVEVYAQRAAVRSHVSTALVTMMCTKLGAE